MSGSNRTEQNVLSCLIKITLYCALFFFFPDIVPASSMPDYQWLNSISISAPTAVAADTKGNIYVTSSSNNKLLIFDRNGEYLNTISGLQQPIGVAVDSYGKIYIGNADSHNVCVYDSDLTFLYKLGSGDGEVSNATSIAVDSTGRIYAADSDNDVVKIYNPDGSYSSSFGGESNDVPTPDGYFTTPSAVAIDEKSQEIIVTDLQLISSVYGPFAGARVQVFDMDGNFKRSFGEYGTEEGMISRPFGIEVDAEHRIYISDARKQAVQVFDSIGTYLGAVYDMTNPIRTPLGIRLDKDNRLYITSLNTSKVEVYQIKDILPLPAGQQAFKYSPVTFPVYSSEPFLSMPVGVGSVASGGDRLTIQVGLNPFSGSVDIYGAFQVSTSPDYIHVLSSDNTRFQVFTVEQILNALSSGVPPHGAEPWKESVTESVSEQIFDLPVLSIPSGAYNIYILVTPSGFLNPYYLWETFFVIP